MVLFRTVFVALALLSTSVSALPRPQDSGIGKEVPVRAPDGVPVTDSVELEKQSSLEAAQSTAAGSYGEKQEGGYGGGYGGGGYEAYTTTSAEKSEETMMGHETTSEMSKEMTSEMSHETTSSMMHEQTSSEKASETTSATYSSPTYGSGSKNWGSEYDDCVQKCVASHGAPPATYHPTATKASEGSEGTGSTVTVIVAPTQGVFRYVPAAINASVGTTIKFMWGAGPHTVTKSSELLPCNKSAEDPVFASGQQEKDFVYTQVVNDTKPTFYFCGVPSHCQKGMFGMVNPPSEFGGATSVGGMMQDMMANSSDLSAYASYTNNVTQGKAGSNWGSSINLKDMPEWSRPLIAENVLFTRNLLAMNPDIIKEDGSTIDLSSVTTTPLMIPQDVGAQLNAAGNSDSGAAGAPSNPPAAPSTTSADAAGASAPANGSNGASALASPKVLVAVMAVVATFFAL
ncbi:hypothetical protein AAF712_001300 [Marasmius tenuissimus]|uniref:Phytocyanin domain-containing protein n=1 Tax=Marasmius tenuissimus TaxID=585030 RepID=A0ABR3ACK1_9AGAR